MKSAERFHESWILVSCLIILSMITGGSLRANVITAEWGDTMSGWVVNKLGLYSDEPDQNIRHQKIMRAVYVIKELNEQVRTSPHYDGDEITAIVDENLIYTGSRYFLPGAPLIRSIVDSQDISLSDTQFQNAVAGMISASAPQATQQYAQAIGVDPADIDPVDPGDGPPAVPGGIPAGGMRLLDVEAPLQVADVSPLAEAGGVDVAELLSDSTSKTLNLTEEPPLEESPNIFLQVWNNVWGWFTGSND